MSTIVRLGGGGSGSKKYIFKDGKWDDKLVKITSESNVTRNSNYIELKANSYINANFRSSITGKKELVLKLDILVIGGDRANLNVWGTPLLNYPTIKNAYNLVDFHASTIMDATVGVPNESVFILCSAWYNANYGRNITVRIKEMYLIDIK